MSSKVKITVEHDGETTVFENEAAFIVSYDDKGDGIMITSAVMGDGTVGDLGQAIADAVLDQHETNDGLASAVMDRIAKRTLKELLDHIAAECEEPAEGDE